MTKEYIHFLGHYVWIKPFGSRAASSSAARQTVRHNMYAEIKFGWRKVIQILYNVMYWNFNEGLTLHSEDGHCAQCRLPEERNPQGKLFFQKRNLAPLTSMLTPASSQGEPQSVAVSRKLPLYWSSKYWHRLLLTSVVHARNQQDHVLICAVQLVTHSHTHTHTFALRDVCTVPRNTIVFITSYVIIS